MGLLKIGCARAVSDEQLTLVAIIIGSLLQEDPFKFLLVELARVFADLNEHLNARSNLSLLDDLALSVTSDLLDQQLDQPLLDRRILNNVVLELAVLHVLDER